MDRYIGLFLAAARKSVTLLAIALVAACSSSGDDAAFGTACVPDDPAAADNCGNVLVAVTDADGDFVSYAVDVLSVTLQRAMGGSVETLPAAARVDFAELTELTELLSAATLAPGEFVGGTIRLDYSGAEIFVEADGDIVAAEVVGEDGLPLGIVDVEVRLADRDHLILTRGRTALLSIDFDLAASHEVDLTTTPVRVTARPYLVAEVSPLTEKALRVRGPLVDVDLSDGSYEIRLRPWHRRDGDFGGSTVHTTAATQFEIGGVPLVGAEGLAALAELETGSLTVAFGTLDTAQQRFTADVVHAGDSVGGDRFAAVHGNVVARSGDTLTVKGALAIYRDRPARFRRTVLVELGVDTAVSKSGDPQATLGKDDISVGQRIVAFGQLTNPNAADADPFAPDIALGLDAAQGRVRMLVTHLHGSVNSVLPGQVNLTLRAIDRLGIEMFDFTGTGSTDDANPADYEVATGTLSLAGLEAGKWARVHGFVTPFGAAPPDFTGRTVVDHRDIPAALGIGWSAGGTHAPFASMGASGLALDLMNLSIGTRHHVLLGRHLVDLNSLGSPPTIAPSPTGGLYGIWALGHIELFTDFGPFVEALAIRLGAGATAQALAAYGSFDDGTATVTARRVVVHMTGTP
ncbi:MAG TPA: metallophosphoesterase [Gammaproteobacteria bacterium]|nr:metallophosphoesterase [Gammaproteobacteria bacterium]